MEKRSSLLKNGISYSFSTLICMIIPLAIYPYIARVLGPEYYGKITYVQTLVSYFVILSTLGINNYAQRLCVSCKNENDFSKAVIEVLAIAGILTSFSLICYVVVVNLSDIDGQDVLIYIFMASLIIFSSLKMEWLITAKEKFVFSASRDIFSRLVLLILAYACIRNKEDYILYAFIYVLSYSLIPGILNFIYVARSKLVRIPKEKVKINLRPHIKPIFYLSLVTIGSKIFSSMDIMMLNSLTNEWTVGIYNNAIKLPLVLDELLMAIAAVVTPRLFAAARDHDEIMMKSLISKTTDSMFFIAVPALVTCVSFSYELVYLLGGEEYVSGANILAVYSVIMITTLCLTVAGTRVFIARGKDKELFGFLIVAGVLNAILDLLLIPKYGGLGAAIATAISNLCLLVAELTYLKTMRMVFDINKCKYVVSGICLFITFAIIKYFSGLQLLPLLVVSILLGGIVYVISLLILKEDTAIFVLDKVHEIFLKVRRH